MAEFLPPLVLELKAKADELHAELDKVRLDVDKTAEESSTKMQKFGQGFQNASGAVAIAGLGMAAAIGGVSVEAAAAAEAVDAKLKVSIENAGGSMEDLDPQIKSLDGTMRGLGFTNEQTNTALATMTTALKDPKQAMDAMSVAADLARTKHIDLNEASLLVTKAMEGQTRPLKALGIDLPIHATNAAKTADAQNKLADAQAKANDILAQFPDAADPASAAHDKYQKAMDGVQGAQEKLTQAQNAGGEIMKDLQDRVKGQADAFGDTLQGKLAATKASYQDMSEKLGNVLLPIVKNVVDAVRGFSDWAEKNPAAFKAIATVFGIVAGAITLIAIATWAWNIAAAANPVVWIILAIIAAIALLVAAFMLIVDNWKVISKVLTDAFNNVMSFFQTVFTAIADWWNGLWSGIGSFFTTIFTGLWAAIVGGFNGLVSFLLSIGSAISNWWNGLWSGIIDFFKGLFGGIGDFVGGIFKGVVNAIIDVLNWLMSPVNTVIDGINAVLNGIRSATGGAISLHLDHLGSLPHFADGGVVPGSVGSPQLIVAHGGEVVLSQAMLSGNAPLPSAASSMQSSRGGAGSGQTVIVNASTNASPWQIASSVGWQLRLMGGA